MSPLLEITSLNRTGEPVLPVRRFGPVCPICLLFHGTTFRLEPKSRTFLRSRQGQHLWGLNISDEVSD